MVKEKTDAEEFRERIQVEQGAYYVNWKMKTPSSVVIHACLPVIQWVRQSFIRAVSPLDSQPGKVISQLVSHEVKLDTI